MKQRKLFLLFLVPAIICIVNFTVAIIVVWLTYKTNTDIRDYMYQSGIFSIARAMSLFNIFFFFICPLLAVISIILSRKKRFSKKEASVSAIINGIIIPSLIIFVIVGVFGGV